MIIESSNFKLKLEDFQKEDSIPLLTSETEKKVFWLVTKWINGEKSFTFHTSGSTGTAKEVIISREKIITSTINTFSYLDKEHKIRSSLLCLDPQFIGGAMVVFRALIKNLNLYITNPSSDFVDHLPQNHRSDLVSVVPLQYRQMDGNDLRRFKNVLIGGAPIAGQQEKKISDTAIYATYGMTETVSHVALRKVDEEYYQTTGDTKVSLDTSDRLQFQGTITDHKLLKTNDIGSAISDHKFRWLGRSDFVINSAGIKVNPETVERKLDEQIINSKFMVTSIPDQKLNEKVILVVEGALKSPLDFSGLTRFERPKEVYQDQKILLTSSGKIDRIATRKKFLDSRKDENTN